MKIKYFKYLFLPIIVLVIGLTASCERDDICPESTPTTPRLIIDVFDINNQESKKNVFGLLIAGVGNNNVLPGYGIVSADNLVLPLKTGESSTGYRVIKDAELDDDGNLTAGNVDIITINYSTELVFVSRACGYKTIFTNVTLNIEQDGDNWIQSKQSINDNQSVEDETTAHFNIFH